MAEKFFRGVSDPTPLDCAQGRLRLGCAAVQCFGEAMVFARSFRVILSEAKDPPETSNAPKA